MKGINKLFALSAMYLMMGEATRKENINRIEQKLRCGLCVNCPKNGATRCRKKNRAVDKMTIASKCGFFEPEKK